MEEEIYLTSDRELETFLSTNGLDDYIRAFREYSPATALENLELIEEYKKGNEKIRELIVYKNFRLVLSYAYKYRRRIKSFELRDILQEGLICIMNAIELFDPEKGIAFSSYAYKALQREINRRLNIADDQVRRSSYFNSLKIKYFKYLNQNPKAQDEEIKRDLEITDEILQLLKSDYTKDTISLSHKIDNDEETTLERFIGEDEIGFNKVLDNMALNDILLWCKLNLSPSKYYIIYHLYLVFNETQETVAHNFGITRQAVNTHAKSALKRLKSQFNKERNFIGKIPPGNYNNVKLEPIDPTLIIKYLYVRDYLNPEEKIILQEVLLGSHIKFIPCLIRKLERSGEEIETLIESTLKKMSEIIADDPLKYKWFKKDILREFKTDILTIDLDLDVTPYKESLNYYYALWKNKTYEEFQAFLEEHGTSIPEHLERKVKYFFGKNVKDLRHPYDLDKKLNKLRFGINRTDQLPKDILLNTLKANEHLFTPKQLDSLLVRLGKMTRQEFEQIYGQYHSCSIHLEKLYCLYFGIRSYRHYNFTREKYLSIRNECLSRIDAESIKILDFFYGYETGKVSNWFDLANFLGIPYESARDALRNAKRQAESVLIEMSHKINLNLDIYRNFLKSSGYTFSNPTQRIVECILFEGKSYQDLAVELNLSNYSISNKLTDALWNIDFRRFGIVKDFDYPKNLLIEALEELNFDDLTKEAIYDYIEFGNGVNTLSKFHISRSVLDDSFRKVKKRLEDKIEETIELSLEDIINGVNAPFYKNVLNDTEREVLSLLYAIQNKFNPEGIKYSSKISREMLGVTYDFICDNKTRALRKLKMQKSGLLRGNLEFMDIATLTSYVRNPRTPINEDERILLSNIYGLDNQEPISLNQCDGKKNSNRRRLYRALVKIYRFKNGEIPEQFIFEEDLEPYLKYFAKSDREMLIEYYKNGKTCKQIAQQRSLKDYEVMNNLYKLRQYLIDIKNSEASFDFDYFYEHVLDEDIPFYGDKMITLEIFKLYFEQGLTKTAILKLYPDFKSENSLTRLLKSLMIAVMKKREGIVKVNDFSYDEVKTYYETNVTTMSHSKRKKYHYYLSTYSPYKIYNTSPIPYSVTYDLMLSQNSFVSIKNMTPKEIKDVLEQYKDKLNQRDKLSLASRAGIPTYQMMHNHDKIQIIKFIQRVSKAKKIETQKTFILESMGNN